MPFTTGTALSPTDLMVQLNTFVTANGWSLVEGETDMACASPKAARYWRYVILETGSVGEDRRRVDRMEFRETVGGANVATNNANYTASSEDGTGFDLVGGTNPLRSADINQEAWWVYYDFGSPQTVREVVVINGDLGEGGSSIVIQWSNDLKTWTTMFDIIRSQGNTSILPSATETYTFDTGFLYDQHASPTVCRRRDRFTDTNQFNYAEQDMFVWQAPGYDINRRIYVGMLGHFDLPTGLHSIECFAGTDWDPLQPDYRIAMEGYNEVNRQYLTFGIDPVEYWFYMDDLHVLVVVKTGTDDYTSAYVGLMGAFSLPTQWAFPLYVGATNDDRVPNSDSSNRNNMAHDPGNGGCAAYYKWDNTWVNVENKADSSQLGLAVGLADEAFVWPWHTGQAGDGSWPLTPIGDNDTFNAHWLDRLQPTEQNELPILPSLVVDTDFGFVGTLIGIFAIAGGNLAVPEQTITIGADTYRVFPHRARRDGHDYFCVLEA